MITQVVYLEKYDWLIKIYYAVDTYYTDLILKELDEIDCDPQAFYALAEQLEAGKMNTGFTYTDSEKHVTFIIIGLTTCASEFANTYDHEKGHAATHIAEYYQIDPYGEEFQYLQGQIGEEMFKIGKKFLCDHCRINMNVNLVNKGKIKMKFY